MSIRMILLSSMQELLAAGSSAGLSAVSINALENLVVQKEVNVEDFSIELQAAIHEADIKFVSPDSVVLTETGQSHYANALKLQ